ncbi:MAG TPA: M48 family metalloprotease [Longimicrobiales bacterium]|nr:M48 family metalloprotease [Longimicrobiales bacterium]
MHPIPSRLAPVVTLGLLVSLGACAVNPATGRRELSLVGQAQEIEMGRSADADVSSSLGLVDAPELQAYVAELGKELAAGSERPELPWSFKVVDDPVVNAFALPGGFIYVTRGILANFESEAELAAVLGHEIGHVTARHSVSQMSRQQLQQLGLGVGMIFSEDVRKFGGVLAAGLGLLNLKYSRGDETQSDELGVRYMTRQGYDPQSMVGVFQMLANVSGGEGGRVPQWQLTHPYPENREAHIREVISSVGASAGGRIGRDALLDRLDGLVYGENPREGYFKGSRFVHPELAFELRFPDGWTTENQRSAVGALSPAKDAMVVLSVAGGAEEPVVALRAFLTQEGFRGGRIREEDAYGNPRASAPFVATTADGEVRGEVMFARHGGSVFRVLAYAAGGRWDSYSAAAAQTLSSFAPLTDRAILGVQPARVEVVTVGRSMSLEEFQAAYPSVVPLEELARLNRLAPGARIAAGARVKRVVGSALP